MTKEPAKLNPASPALHALSLSTIGPHHEGTVTHPAGRRNCETRIDKPPEAMDPRLERTWSYKIRHALRGTRRAMRAQSGFYPLFLLTAILAAVALVANASPNDWVLLILAVTIALAAEGFRASIAAVVKELPEPASKYRDALDMTSGAVLLATLGSMTAAGLLIAHRMIQMLH